jgi:hypothetical protein
MRKDPRQSRIHRTRGFTLIELLDEDSAEPEIGEPEVTA